MVWGGRLLLGGISTTVMLIEINYNITILDKSYMNFQIGGYQLE